MRIFKRTFPAIVLIVLATFAFQTEFMSASMAYPLPSVNLQSTEEATPEASLSISGDFDVNGRSMYLDCQGSGSPTIVFETGEGGTSADFSELQDRLSASFMTCVYDRAGNGRSDSASVPRTAVEAVEDLHSLLDVAEVPEPYLLVGHSAGGLLVQLYARTFPDQVAGVVAMNPVPPADPWLDEVRSVFTDEEYAGEEAYYNGANGESLDYVTSSEQLANAPEPPQLPFEMLISTVVQCQGDAICVKSYGIYEQTLEAVTDEWPCGNFTQVEANHDIFSDDADTVVDAIEQIMTTLLPDAESCASTQSTE